MVFSSPIFLFFFLPLVLIGSMIFRRRGKNAFLLAASFLFYAWGEAFWAWVICLSIAANFGFGLFIDRTKRKKAALAVAIAANLGLLATFKYGNFFVDDLNAAARVFGAPALHLGKIHLPIGISFFTFHALSYLIDIYRGDARAQKNPVDFALYITMFPQLIAGPIIRYRDVEDQLATHRATLPEFSLGVRRFVLGLGKKVLIANTVATSVDAVFSLPGRDLSAETAWLGAALYMLQIYFDFSAYSDMAIGLAHMFGLRFRENFDYPYVSRSVTEFWRRWHISLSTWFRDYLYIPLGGNRFGAKRTYTNLVVVFFLCGLWHGASFTFVAWGLFHGAFLVLERVGLGSVLARVPRLLRHAYLLLVVMVGWVLFRADSFQQAGALLAAMAGFGSGSSIISGTELLRRDVLLAAAAGIIGSTPWIPWLSSKKAALGESDDRKSLAAYAAWEVASAAALAVVFFACAALLASGTYNPFIYFRF